MKKLSRDGWAVIAAFVVFAGTKSWGDTLSKGWQRLLGTVLGVPSGVLVATLVSGNTVASLVMIFACLFCAFYFMRVTYSKLPCVIPGPSRRRIFPSSRVISSAPSERLMLLFDHFLRVDGWQSAL